MSEPYIGQIIIFAGNFAPANYALCNGPLMSIAQNAALFSLLGTTYGGDGISNFALPNLQGRVPIHMGDGAGLSPYVLGQNGGQPSHTLTINEMAAHRHSPQYTANGTLNPPGGNLFAPDPNGNVTFAAGGTEQMATDAIQTAGGNQPHENQAPSLVLNFCIALFGIYPSRN
jgi:microcystin-dependent protein